MARERFADSPREVRFVHSNAEEAELEGPYDVVVSSYIPKYVDADRLMARVVPHLRPGAVVAFHDFAHPNGFVPRLVWTAHMRMLVGVGLRVFPEWNVVFDHRLEDLIRDSHWPTAFRHAMDRAGFSAIAIEKLSFGSAKIISARLPVAARG